MAQINVRLVSTNDQDNSVTLLIGGRRIEFFIGDRYYQGLRHIRTWLDSGWHNQVVTRCTEWAEQIIIEDEQIPPWQKRNERKVRKMSTSIEHKSTPSEEFSFTLIAPQAKSLNYADERKWFKTADDARLYAASIYDGCGTHKHFDLCVVQCVDVVAPKPQIELTSRWRKGS